jgi:Toprim domain
MQQIAERLQMGLLPGPGELDVKRNPCEAADSQVIGVGAVPAPDAHLGFRRRAILAGDGAHRHPRCFYRTTDESTRANRYEVWAALLATVSDLSGKVTGVHRTWLDPSGRDKAPVPSPRRALGEIAGHGVRFGTADDVMATGEGLETVLSVRTILPAMPVAAALSANHLAVFRSPPAVRRLYVAQDNDSTGRRAAQQLSCRARAGGIEAITLAPRLKDFNDDLRQLGVAALRATLRKQLVLEDLSRFMASEAVTVR